MKGIAVLTVALFLSIPAAGQAPAFEAASVKPNTSGDLRMRGGTRGRTYSAVNLPLRRIVSAAYELEFEAFRLAGDQPILSNRFDITATLPEKATPRDVPVMLRTMLADRFILRVHTEMRDTPVLALTLARRDGRLGAQLRRAAVDCVEAAAAGRTVPQPAPGQEQVCGSEVGESIKGRGQPLSSLARMLAQFVQRRIEDKTGLTGGFDFDLQFDYGAAGPGVDTVGALITALQDQLGLKLESTRAPVEFVVVDRIEAPTPD